MGHFTAEALHVMQRQSNIISFRQLQAAGMSPRVRRRMIEDGVLEHVGKTVVAVSGLAMTLERRCIALCLQHPQGYVTGPTGGVLLRQRRMPRLSEISFGVPHGLHIDVPPGVRLRQTTILPQSHRRQLDNGIVIASWPRLAFDLATDLPRIDLHSVIDQMIHDGHTDVAALVATARLLCARGRAGSLSFANVLLERGGRMPLESHSEVLVFERLRRHGVPVEPQVRRLELPNGQHIRIDMAVESLRWAVEVDVHPAHVELPGTTRDKRRDRQLHLIDWQVERLTPLDLLDLTAITRELVDLYHARRAAIRARSTAVA